ncbi:sugar phosphate isomerase/epimerase [Litoribacter ruber]|uniref:Sugar phosphate isomerase/epimerase n=1 Tax=Litoribacter ruber TaxID=702568 RepID=A0AAP2CHB1_9BACT|nr:MULTISPECIES: sugar phosphate isomerase/epimerase [Litoribacter]MBS9523780.1 sugar phosphate isomerase/epimerase [Litoribacter alkaliphilus]MBT0812764.1 sugar phosphate isomerase/epimerase [Litoribacter ruber]
MSNRRDFIKLSSLMAAGAFLPLQFCGRPDTVVGDDRSEEGLDRFGIQLYSVKDEMFANVQDTISQLGSYGYHYLEGFDGGKGIFWGMKNTEFKKLVEDQGMEFVASHANVFQNLEEQAKQAGEIGMKYLICPWVGPQESMDEFKRLADEFNRIGKVCKEEGVRFAYHNHGYTFEELEGQMPQDYLLENTDPDLVDYEMDIYWVKTPGADPKVYFEKYPDRFKLCHVKDRMKDAPQGEADASTDIGEGSIDFSSILRVGKENGLEYFFAEQERYDASTPMRSAEKNAEYLRNLRLA